MTATGQIEQAPAEQSGPLPYAGFQLRAVALILDCIVVVSFLLLFAAIAFLPVALGSDDKVSDTEERWILVTLLSFLFFVPIMFVMLWATRGQSFGMMAVGIEVYERDGHPITLARAILRGLVWPLSMFPFGLGALTLLFDDERRALHDVIAGTVVVELP